MTTVACLYCCSCLFIKMCNNLSMEVSNLQASSSSSLKLSSFSYSSFPTENEPEQSYLQQVFQKHLPLLVFDMIFQPPKTLFPGQMKYSFVFFIFVLSTLLQFFSLPFAFLHGGGLRFASNRSIHYLIFSATASSARYKVNWPGSQ